eukprot:31545-Pelagococcus_subviridis.AAC.2
MTFLKLASFDSSLAFTASNTSFTGGNAFALASYFSARIPRHTSCHPPNFSATNTCAASHVLIGGGGPAPFFFGGAVALATPFRIDDTRSSRYRAAAMSALSGSTYVGNPAFVTVPGFPRSAPHTCSHVCGQNGARRSVETSMKRFTSSACMLPSSPKPPHWSRYASRADCRS